MSLAVAHTFGPQAGPIPLSWLDDMFANWSKTVVNTIAELRTVLKTQAGFAFALGYYAAGDGGGGSYYYNASDTSSPDNGGTIIVATDGGRWYLSNYTRVNAKQFGAKYDGVTDDTVAHNNAITFLNGVGGGILDLPPGTTVTQQVTIKANVKVLGAGMGATSVKPTAGFALNAFWVVAANAVNFEVAEFQMTLDKATYPSTVCLYVSGSAQRGWIHDLYFPKSGQSAIYTINVIDVVIERVRSLLASGVNIQIDGASSQFMQVIACYVDALGGVSHGIQFLGGGFDHRAHRNYVQRATTFGISLFGVLRSWATHNTSYNSGHEGINVQDGSDCHVTENTVYWDNTTSQDFGISVFGQAGGGSSFHLIRGNKIINCGKSGIGLDAVTTVQFCRVDGNTILNSNRLNGGIVGGNGAGIIVYGTGAQFNEFNGNTVFDNINTLQYGYFEWNSGGTPSNNHVVDLKVTNAALGNINKSTSSTEALSQAGWLAYNTVVTPGSGSITTLGTVTARYQEVDKLVYFMVSITITTNGTGAGTINFTLPFTNGPVPVVAAGRENGLTGSSLNVQIGASSANASISTYNNSYPGGSGAIIEVAGFFMKA